MTKRRTVLSCGTHKMEAYGMQTTPSCVTSSRRIMQDIWKFGRDPEGSDGDLTDVL
jgi:hypothetical protein